MNQDDLPGTDDAKTLADQAGRALDDGRPFEALIIASEGVRRFKSEPRLRQLQGLALARSGASEQAHCILGQLVEEGHRDAETLGMFARTHKDFGLAAGSPGERELHFRNAQQLYAEAYQITGGYWTGINAATLATLLGETEKAVGLARAVRDQCLREREGGGADYWLLATLGEAELILRNWSEAECWYSEAAAASEHRFGHRGSSRRQARLLLQHHGRDSQWVDRLLSVPKVALFVGHMCDRPGRHRTRFPPELEEPVQLAIHERLKKQDALVGFSSAACGSDILFLQALLALQGEAHVVLPYQKDQFARDSVDIVPGWKHRYDALIETLTTNTKTPPRVVEIAHGKMELQSASYDYANLVLHGLAMRRAKELDSELACLAVWDGRPGDGPSGTASVVQRWEKLGLKVERINLTEMLQNHCPALNLTDDPSQPVETAVARTPPPPETKVLAMLFADAVGYSRLAEREAVNFTRHCLGAICRLLLDWPHEAIVRESRGDGVYLAFETVRDAGLFALALRDLMAKTTWTDKNLPAELKLRIGLHAGPVCRCFDPILGSQTWTGAHVSRAARIEQSGQGGLVCASQEFAALAAVENVTEFSCDYVETRELPKQYGTLPLYSVNRRTNSPT